MQNSYQMKKGNVALTNFFECETTAFPKVRVVAEIVIDRGKIHHVNTDEIKAALENAVKNAVWYCCKPKGESCAN